MRVDLNQLSDKLGAVFKATYPQFKDSADRIFRVVIDILDASTQLASIYLEAVLKIVNQHQKDIEELTTVISELVQDVAKIIYKGATQIDKELRDFTREFVQQVRALPIYEVVQNVYRDAVNYRVPDFIVGPIEELLKDIKILLPTQELRDFFATVYNYILKHVKHEDVRIKLFLTYFKISLKFI